jgi:hypothetical protein
LSSGGIDDLLHLHSFLVAWANAGGHVIEFIGAHLHLVEVVVRVLLVQVFDGALARLLDLRCAVTTLSRRSKVVLVLLVADDHFYFDVFP